MTFVHAITLLPYFIFAIKYLGLILFYFLNDFHDTSQKIDEEFEVAKFQTHDCWFVEYLPRYFCCNKCLLFNSFSFFFMHGFCGF